MGSHGIRANSLNWVRLLGEWEGFPDPAARLFDSRAGLAYFCACFRVGWSLAGCCSAFRRRLITLLGDLSLAKSKAFLSIVKECCL